MKLTPHFSLKELGGDEFYEYFQNMIRLANNLEVLRQYTGPLIITGPWRSAERNRAVGGARNSLHLKGLAVDLKAGDPLIPVTTLYDIIDELQHQNVIDKGGLGLYTAHVHYDIRGKIVRWRSEKP